jgi:hypothetical protein
MNIQIGNLSRQLFLTVLVLLLGGTPIVAGACPVEPVEISVSMEPDVLWPPNHKYVQLNETITVTGGGCGPITIALLSVTSNEPDNGLGDGDKSNDILINGDFDIQVRAERSGQGSGRTYTICYSATDASGNTEQDCDVVSVPLNQSN